MAENLHTILSRRFRPRHEPAERANLSLKEQQTTYILNFGKRRKCVSYQIDGYIITDGNKCDYLILARQDGEAEWWKAIFVELKGTDVEHALVQLDAAMGNPVFRHSTVNERHARIVARSFPANKANPKFEKAKRDFKTRHNCSLKQVSSGNPDRID